MDAKDAAFWQEEIRLLPLQQPLLLALSTSAEDALSAMQKKKTGCALIIDSSGNYAGIFTERTVMEKFIGTDLPSSAPVSDVMSTDRPTIKPSNTVVEALDMFGSNPIRHIPVVGADKEILGLLSIRVMVDFIAEHLPDEVKNLPPNLNQLSHTTDGG